MGNEGGRGEKSILAEIILFLAKSYYIYKNGIMKGEKICQREKYALPMLRCGWL